MPDDFGGLPHQHQRLWEAAQTIPADVYVCVNGDEPLIDPQVVEQVLPQGLEGFFAANLMAPIHSPAEAVDESNIKVVANGQGNALYFSRSPIPHPKGSLDFLYYKHLGVLAYTKEALEFFAHTPKGPLEQVEDVNELRFVEHGKPLRMIPVESRSLSVDTEKDLAHVRRAGGGKIAARKAGDHMSMEILDCTLRDGGYINNWRFGRETIAAILEKLDQAGIDIIECGFLTREGGDRDCSLFSSLEAVEAVLPRQRRARYVAMIAMGEKELEPSALPDNDGRVLQGVRLTFHKAEADKAFCWAKELMAKGYPVYLQPVGTVSYSDLELLHLVEKVNVLEPYASISWTPWAACTATR